MTTPVCPRYAGYRFRAKVISYGVSANSSETPNFGPMPDGKAVDPPQAGAPEAF
jgi:hypothetical protein